jgi:hypothetical protein
MQLNPEVRSVLEESTVVGNRLTLPRQLDRKLYVSTAKVLELIGGKWNKKAQAHLFEEDAELVVADVVATGAVVDFRKEFQFFETPEATADVLCGWADLYPGLHVLEPSAGRGRIVEAIRKWGVLEPGPFACELWNENRAVLQSKNVSILADDFLQLPVEHRFDRIIANPPFSRQQDILHVTKMYSHLDSNGRLVSVMSPAWQYRADRRTKAFKALLDEARNWTWTPLPEGTFKASGTGVNTGVILIDKGN